MNKHFAKVPSIIHMTTYATQAHKTENFHFPISLIFTSNTSTILWMILLIGCRGIRSNTLSYVRSVVTLFGIVEKPGHRESKR